MKKKIAQVKFAMVLFFMLCSIFSFSGCANKDENTISLPNVYVGDTFDIRVKSYSGTAYRWDYEMDSTMFEYVSSEFIPTNNNSDQIGGGQIIYKFKALKDGKDKIEFCVKDVSQQNALPIERIIYEITVEERSITLELYEKGE